MQRIIGLVTLYNPQQSVVDNMRVLSQQVDRVFLMDNSKDDNSLLFTDLVAVTYTKNEENLGLSGAFNLGLGICGAHESDYIIFFDQDSRVSDNFIQCIRANYESLSFTHNVGCIGPMIYDRILKGNVYGRDRLSVGNDCYRVENVITSGLLTRFGVLKDIGFWNTDIFLDYADWDLCWRMKEKGFLVAQSDNVILNHCLGEKILSYHFFYIRVNSSFRIYYIIRDGLKLLFRRYVPINYRLLFIRNIFLAPLVQLLFMKNRLMRSQAIVFGYLHFLLAKSGEYPR